MVSFGKYKILEFLNNGKCKVQCTKCGWIGITTNKTVKRTIGKESKKCSHIGGSTIHSGDKFGKYIVIHRSPSKLCNNGLLIPYYKCKCTKCNNVVNVSVTTLYATKGRNTYDTCRHFKEILV